MHPLLGLGNNNFAVYYEFVTGKANYGAHSYWVAVIVESGLIGLVLWIVFLRYVFLRLRAARRLGRLLDRIGDPEGSRVRPLAYGMTAALVGTIVANFFYLTIQFYYFYAFLAFALALPVVFAGRARGQPVCVGARRRPHDVVAADGAGVRRPLRRRRRGAAARARGGGGGARARVRLPGLRPRLRRRDGGERPAPALAGAAHALLDVAGRAARGALGRSRPRALAADRGGRALRAGSRSSSRCTAPAPPGASRTRSSRASGRGLVRSLLRPAAAVICVSETLAAAVRAAGLDPW